MGMFKNRLIMQVLGQVQPQCHLCHHPITGDTQVTDSRLWCPDCFDHLQGLENHSACMRCGLPLAADSEQKFGEQTSTQALPCPHCAQQPPPWDRLFCLSDYQAPLKSYIHQFKYQGHFWLANNLGALLANKFTCQAPVLLPVPLHWHKYMKRGFNQSEYLADAMAKHWKTHEGIQVHVLKGALSRHLPTEPQKGLTQSQRLLNTKNAFSLQHEIYHKHVALVDDVVTTGSTLKPICELLRQQGVEQIDVYCLARTQLD